MLLLALTILLTTHPAASGIIPATTVSAATAPATAPAIAPFDLPRYETKAYDVYSDLDAESLIGVFARVDRMTAMYRAETRSFSRDAVSRMPLAIFRTLRDYENAGGPHGSAGFFDGETLLTFAGPGHRADARTWHILQHEGFHQFAHSAISDHLPTWLNEGMAEYFGEAIFTGDGFMVGLNPEWRRLRIRQSIMENKFKSLQQFASLSPDDWNANVSIVNYDQAWSLVQFLLQDNRPAFEHFVKSIVDGTTQEKAWHDAFPHSPDDIEAAWKKWWLNLPANSTDEDYARATVATLTSFLARAAAERVAYRSFDDFATACERHALPSSVGDVLPDDLLDEAINDVRARIADGAKFTLTAPPEAQLKMAIHYFKSGKEAVGSFELKDVAVENVRVR